MLADPQQSSLNGLGDSLVDREQQASDEYDQEAAASVAATASGSSTVPARKYCACTPTRKRVALGVSIFFLIGLAALVADLLRVKAVSVSLHSADISLQADSPTSMFAHEDGSALLGATVDMLRSIQGPAISSKFEVRLTNGPRSMSADLLSLKCQLFTGNANGDKSILSMSYVPFKNASLPLQWHERNVSMAQSVYGGFVLSDFNIEVIRHMMAEIVHGTSASFPEHYSSISISCQGKVKAALFGINMGTHSVSFTEHFPYYDGVLEMLQLKVNEKFESAMEAVTTRYRPRFSPRMNSSAIYLPVPIFLPNTGAFAHTRSLKVHTPALRYDVIADFAAIAAGIDPRFAKLIKTAVRQVEKFVGSTGVDFSLLPASLEFASLSSWMSLSADTDLSSLPTPPELEIDLRPILPFTKRSRSCRTEPLATLDIDRPALSIDFIPCIAESTLKSASDSVAVALKQADIITAFIGEHNNMAIHTLSPADTKKHQITRSLQRATDPPGPADPSASRYCVGFYFNHRAVLGVTGCVAWFFRSSPLQTGNWSYYSDRYSMEQSIEVNLDIRTVAKFSFFHGMSVEENPNILADLYSIVNGVVRYELEARDSVVSYGDAAFKGNVSNALTHVSFNMNESPVPSSSPARPSQTRFGAAGQLTWKTFYPSEEAVAATTEGKLVVKTVYDTEDVSFLTGTFRRDGSAKSYVITLDEDGTAFEPKTPPRIKSRLGVQYGYPADSDLYATVIAFNLAKNGNPVSNVDARVEVDTFEGSAGRIAVKEAVTEGSTDRFYLKESFTLDRREGVTFNLQGYAGGDNQLWSGHYASVVFPGDDTVMVDLQEALSEAFPVMEPDSRFSLNHKLSWAGEATYSMRNRVAVKGDIFSYFTGTVARDANASTEARECGLLSLVENNSPLIAPIDTRFTTKGGLCWLLGDSLYEFNVNAVEVYVQRELMANMTASLSINNNDAETATITLTQPSTGGLAQLHSQYTASWGFGPSIHLFSVIGRTEFRDEVLTSADFAYMWSNSDNSASLKFIESDAYSSHTPVPIERARVGIDYKLNYALKAHREETTMQGVINGLVYVDQSLFSNVNILGNLTVGLADPEYRVVHIVKFHVNEGYALTPALETSRLYFVFDSAVLYENHDTIRLSVDVSGDVAVVGEYIAKYDTSIAVKGGDRHASARINICNGATCARETDIFYSNYSLAWIYESSPEILGDFLVKGDAWVSQNMLTNTYVQVKFNNDNKTASLTILDDLNPSGDVPVPESARFAMVYGTAWVRTVDATYEFVNVTSQGDIRKQGAVVSHLEQATQVGLPAVEGQPVVVEVRIVEAGDVALTDTRVNLDYRITTLIPTSSSSPSLGINVMGSVHTDVPVAHHELAIVYGSPSISVKFTQTDVDNTTNVNYRFGVNVDLTSMDPSALDTKISTDILIRDNVESLATVAVTSEGTSLYHLVFSESNPAMGSSVPRIELDYQVKLNIDPEFDTEARNATLSGHFASNGDFISQIETSASWLIDRYALSTVSVAVNESLPTTGTRFATAVGVHWKTRFTAEEGRNASFGVDASVQAGDFRVDNLNLALTMERLVNTTDNVGNFTTSFNMMLTTPGAPAHKYSALYHGDYDFDKHIDYRVSASGTINSDDALFSTNSAAFTLSAMDGPTMIGLVLKETPEAVLPADFTELRFGFVTSVMVNKYVDDGDLVYGTARTYYDREIASNLLVRVSDYPMNPMSYIKPTGYRVDIYEAPSSTNNTITNSDGDVVVSDRDHVFDIGNVHRLSVMNTVEPNITASRFHFGGEFQFRRPHITSFLNFDISIQGRPYMYQNISFTFVPYYTMEALEFKFLYQLGSDPSRPLDFITFWTDIRYAFMPHTNLYMFAVPRLAISWFGNVYVNTLMNIWVHLSDAGSLFLNFGWSPSRGLDEQDPNTRFLAQYDTRWDIDRGSGIKANLTGFVMSHGQYVSKVKAVVDATHSGSWGFNGTYSVAEGITAEPKPETSRFGAQGQFAMSKTVYEGHRSDNSTTSMSNTLNTYYRGDLVSHSVTDVTIDNVRDFPRHWVYQDYGYVARNHRVSVRDYPFIPSALDSASSSSSDAAVGATPRLSADVHIVWSHSPTELPEEYEDEHSLTYSISFNQGVSSGRIAETTASATGTMKLELKEVIGTNLAKPSDSHIWIDAVTKYKIVDSSDFSVNTTMQLWAMQHPYSYSWLGVSSADESDGLGHGVNLRYTDSFTDTPLPIRADAAYTMRWRREDEPQDAVVFTTIGTFTLDGSVRTDASLAVVYDLDNYKGRLSLNESASKQGPPRVQALYLLDIDRSHDGSVDLIKAKLTGGVAYQEVPTSYVDASITIAEVFYGNHRFNFDLRATEASTPTPAALHPVHARWAFNATGYGRMFMGARLPVIDLFIDSIVANYNATVCKSEFTATFMPATEMPSSDGTVALGFIEGIEKELDLDHARRAYGFTVKYHHDAYAYYLRDATTPQVVPVAYRNNASLVTFARSLGIRVPDAFDEQGRSLGSPLIFPEAIGLYCVHHEPVFALFSGVVNQRAFYDILTVPAASGVGYTVRDRSFTSWLGEPFTFDSFMGAAVVFSSKWTDPFTLVGDLQSRIPSYYRASVTREWQYFRTDNEGGYSTLLVLHSFSEAVAVDVEFLDNVVDPTSAVYVRRDAYPDAKHYDVADITPGRIKSATWTVPSEYMTSGTVTYARVKGSELFPSSFRVRIRDILCSDAKCNSAGSCSRPVFDTCKCNTGFAGSDCSAAKERVVDLNRPVESDVSAFHAISYELTVPQPMPKSLRVSVDRGLSKSPLKVMVQRGRVPTMSDNIGVVYLTDSTTHASLIVDTHASNLTTTAYRSNINVMHGYSSAAAPNKFGNDDAEFALDSDRFYVKVENTFEEPVRFKFVVATSQCNADCGLHATCDEATEQCVCLPGYGFPGCTRESTAIAIGGEPVSKEAPDHFFTMIDLASLVNKNAKPWGVAFDFVKKVNRTDASFHVTQFTYPDSTRFTRTVTSTQRDSRQTFSIYYNNVDMEKNVNNEPLYAGVGDSAYMPFTLSAREIFCPDDCNGNGFCEPTLHTCSCHQGFNWTQSCALEVKTLAADGNKITGSLSENAVVMHRYTSPQPRGILSVVFTRASAVTSSPIVYVSPSFASEPTATDRKYEFEAGAAQLTVPIHAADGAATFYLRMVAPADDVWIYGASASWECGPDCDNDRNSSPIGVGVWIGIGFGIAIALGVTLYCFKRRGCFKNCCGCCKTETLPEGTDLFRFDSSVNNSKADYSAI